MKDQDSSVDQVALTVKQALRRFAPKYLMIWGHSVFITLLAFTPFLYLRQVMGRVYDSRSWETLIFLTAIVVFAVVVMRILHYFRAIALAGIGEQINEQLRSRIFTVVHERGEKDSFRYFGDVSALRNGLTGSFIASAMDASLSPLFIGVMYLLHPVLGLAAIGFVGVIGLISILKAQKIKRIKADVKPLEDQAFAFGLATSSKHSAIRSMNLLPGIRRKWLDLQAEASQVSVGGQGAVAIYDGFLGFLRASEIVLIVGLSAVLYLLDEITADVGFAAFIIMMRGVTPILAIAQNWGVIEETRSAYTRLETLLSEADTRQRIAPNELEGELSCETLGFWRKTGARSCKALAFVCRRVACLA